MWNISDLVPWFQNAAIYQNLLEEAEYIIYNILLLEWTESEKWFYLA